MGEGPDGPTAQNRPSGLGALQDYVGGPGIGALYGLTGPNLRHVRTLRAGTVFSLGAMAASDVPIAASGVSDPGEWGTNAWLSDLVPHLAYVPAATYKALTSGRRPA